jgi:ribosomal protein S18 acetylase RimI-like enzyme
MSSQNPEQPHEKTRPRFRVTRASGEKYESRTTPLLAGAFQTDPLFGYYLNKIPRVKRLPILEKLMHLISTAARLNHADFYAAGVLREDEQEQQENPQPKFESAAIFVPPGKAVDQLGFSAWCTLLKEGVVSLICRTGINSFMRLLFEYPAVSEQAKKTTLRKGEQYYYLLLIGTSVEHRGKGLAPAMIKDYQVIAQEKGFPIWLEASSRGAMAVYAKTGFENIGGRWVIGEGKCDAAGERAKGAAAVGVEIYPMVWWPKNYARPGEKK